MNCSDITKGLIAAECGKNVIAGAEHDCLILNHSDIDRVKSVVADNVLSSVILNTGKKGFSFSTIDRSFNDAGYTFSKGTYRNFVSHSVPLTIFIKTEEGKKFVNQFVEGAKAVIILKNKEGGAKGEVKYEVYGWENGLELSELADTIAMTDGVVHRMVLSSSDTAQETTLPKSVFATDLAATELMLQSLGLVTRALMNNQGAVIQNGEGRAITVNSEE